MITSYKKGWLQIDPYILEIFTVCSLEKKDFLINYLQEKIIPNNIPKYCGYYQRIFPDYIASFLESPIKHLKLQ